jgi:two-component system nitrogen regulation response regulator NtrX
MKNTILIVEDSMIYQAMLQKLSQDKGYKTQSSADGMEAIIRLNQGCEHICAIFLDINMPNIDGISLLGHLQAKHRDIPVIIISGDEDAEHNEKTCLQLGATTFIHKPLDADKIEKIFNTITHFYA